jgi:hypothetical protein
MLDILGWLGSVLLAICGIFEAIPAIIRGYTRLTLTFLLAWLFGEIFVLIPVLLKIKEPYLIFNYGLNIIFISVILKYKIFPRNNIFNGEKLD